MTTLGVADGSAPEATQADPAKEEEVDKDKALAENMVNPVYDGSAEDCPMEEEENKSLERKLCEEMHNSEFKADMDLIEAMEEEESRQEEAAIENLPELAI